MRGDDAKEREDNQSTPPLVRRLSKRGSSFHCCRLMTIGKPNVCRLFSDVWNTDTRSSCVSNLTRYTTGMYPLAMTRQRTSTLEG